MSARAILRTSPKSFWKKFEKVLNMDKMQKFPPCLLFTHNLCQWNWTRKSCDKGYGRFFVWNEYSLLLVIFCQFMSLLFFCLLLILSWNMCISFVKTQTMGINILQEKIGRQFYKWLLFIGVPCSSNILAHNLSIQKRLKWCKYKLKKSTIL